MQLRNPTALLQGKNITGFVSRLISCGVFGTIHKTSSELQAVEGEATSQTAAAVQQVSIQLQGKFKVPITYNESKRDFLIPAFSCELVVGYFSQNANVCFLTMNKIGFFPFHSAPRPHISLHNTVI